MNWGGFLEGVIFGTIVGCVFVGISFVNEKVKQSRLL